MSKKEFSWSEAFVGVKFIAFIIFVSLSAFISINLFMHLSSNPFDQYVMLAFAFALELFKVYILIRANTLYRVHLKKKALVAYGIYFGSVLISVIASFGFTLTVLDRSIQENSLSPTALTLQQTKDEIQQHKDTIKMYQDSISIANDQITQIKDQAKAFADQQKKNQAEGKPVQVKDFNPSITKLSNTISDYQTKIQDETSKIPPLNEKAISLSSKLSIEESDKKNTSNMFQLMANTLAGTILAVKDITIQLILLVLIASIIEIGIIICSPSITIDKEHIYHFLGEDLSREEIDKIKLELFGPDEENLLVQEAIIEEKIRKPRQRKIRQPKEKSLDLNDVRHSVVKEPVNETTNEEKAQPIGEIAVEEPAKVIEEFEQEIIQEIKEEPVILEEKKEVKPQSYHYVAGIMSQPEMTHLLRFVDELFNGDQDGRHLLDESLAAKRAEIPLLYLDNFFNILKKVTGKTGLPMITVSEINADKVVWSANYNLQTTKAHLSTVLSRGVKK